MTKLEQAEKLLSEMSQVEKAQVLQLVVRELGEEFPGIESTPDICGGEARIVRTRIPVWVIEQARRLGTSEADILRSFPTLRASDIVNALAYAISHQEEIDRNINENEAA